MTKLHDVSKIAQDAALLFHERTGLVQTYNEEFISVLIEVIKKHEQDKPDLPGRLPVQ